MTWKKGIMLGLMLNAVIAAAAHYSEQAELRKITVIDMPGSIRAAVKADTSVLELTNDTRHNLAHVKLEVVLTGADGSKLLLEPDWDNWVSGETKHIPYLTGLDYKSAEWHATVDDGELTRTQLALHGATLIEHYTDADLAYVPPPPL